MSWTIERATGIVLSRRDHREADRWYSVFTRERGKLEFLARGGHKPLAKLTPHLEMVSVVDLMLVNGHAFYTVAGVERLESFPRVYNDLVKLMLVQNALYLVDIGTREEEADMTIYDLLQRWLGFLNSDLVISQERGAFLLAAFGLKLMSLVGYRPELRLCLGCRRAIEEGAFSWHALKGGVVCNKCVSSDQDQWFAARSITNESLKLLRFALEESFDTHIKPRLRGEDLVGFHEAVESLIVSHFPMIPASSLREACAV
jgi:DNA repair protein RecO (recombination protein O)